MPKNKAAAIPVHRLWRKDASKTKPEKRSSGVRNAAKPFFSECFPKLPKLQGVLHGVFGLNYTCLNLLGGARCCTMFFDRRYPQNVYTILCFLNNFGKLAQSCIYSTWRNPPRIEGLQPPNSRMFIFSTWLEPRGGVTSCYRREGFTQERFFPRFYTTWFSSKKPETFYPTSFLNLKKSHKGEIIYRIL